MAVTLSIPSLARSGSTNGPNLAPSVPRSLGAVVGAKTDDLLAAWAAGTTPCGEFVAPAGTPAPEMLVRFRYVSLYPGVRQDVQPTGDSVANKYLRRGFVSLRTASRRWEPAAIWQGRS
jgi:hypothetical protein